MRNSNQPSFSVSIRSKRQNLRNQIRKQKLQQVFKAKRFELQLQKQTDQKYLLYRQLNQKILNLSSNRQEAQQVEAIMKDTLNRFPSFKLNFTLIGNFLLIRSQKFLDFQQYILSQENINLALDKDYLWCWAIFINIVCGLEENHKKEKKFVELIKKIEMFLGLMIQKYSQSFKLSEQSIRILKNYVFSFNSILYSVENLVLFPINSFNSFFGLIGKFYPTISNQEIVPVRDLKIEITRLINQIVDQIKTKELFSNQIRQFVSQGQQQFILTDTSKQNFMRFASKVFEQNIMAPSDEKLNCIESIKKLCQCSPLIAGQCLFTKNNVFEFMFLMLNYTTKTKESLLRSFNAIIPSIRNTQLINFLDQSVHINFTQLLKQEVNSLKNNDSSYRKSSDCLFYTIKVIETMLYRAAQLSGQILKNVMNSMEIKGFGDIIEEMSTERFDERIEQILCNIIDCYFSEDRCEEHIQDEHNCRKEPRNIFESYQNQI